MKPGALTALLQEVAATPEQREPEPASLSPGTVIGRFEILRELGRGGFGVVYEARDRNLGRQVAVKVVRPGRITEEDGKVSREAEAIARLAHPNLITLHEVGRSDHGPFLVFELLRGKTLDLRIEEGPLPLQEVVHVATEVARGLAHAHAEGVIHRDLKPANVFVTNKGQVKILDFGMAHAFGRRRLSGGTPAYMAPEQWEDAPEDERTDVFALGVMLYRMLTGEYPFPEGQGRWSAEPATVRKLDVPGAPELAELVEKMLDPAPTRRPRDGAAVVAALTPIEDRLRAKPADGSTPAHAKRRKATFGDLLAELRRRHVFRVMIGYGVFAFAVLQVTEPIMHGADLPNWVLKAVLVALVLGFPIAVILAWAYDLTAQGVKRTPSATGPGAPRFGRSRFLLPLAVAAGVLAIAAAGAGGWYAWKRASERGSAASAPALAPSIAVLPFADMSPGKDQDYFADGIAEEILGALSRVGGLRVPGRSSSFWFKGRNVDPAEIARKLGVTHLLEGSVRRSGSKLRITAEVVKASTGERVWSETYERELTDVFAIQDEIARSVVRELAPMLMARTPPPPPAATTNPEAYRLFLLGRSLTAQSTPESIRRALEALERSAALDPSFAPTQAYLAVVRGNLSTGARGEERQQLRKAEREAADRAVTLDPSSPLGYVVRAVYRMRQDLDWEGASQDLDRAMVIDAANEGVLNVRAILLATLGRTREAVELERRAVDLSPLNVAHTSNLAYFLATDGQYAEAREWARRSLEISPGNTRSVNVLAYAALLTGKAEEALADFGRSSEPVRSAGIVAALHSLGREQESRDALARMERDHADEPFHIAAARAWLGDLDGAFAEFDRSIQERNPYLANVKNLPLLRPIRGDRRYAALLKRLNLPVDAGPTTAPPTTVAATPSIAVLPFADMSPKHDQEYFADGVAEEIRSALAQVGGLKVIGRTSSFAFKGKTDDLKTIGQQLGVANVLEGSLRKDGSGIRVTAQLIRVGDGTHLWSESYDRKLPGIFKVQDEIGKAVVAALKVKLMPGATVGTQGMTANLEAHQHYLRGRDITRASSTENLKKAEMEYEKAVALDPAFALAWAGLAHTLRTLEAFDSVNQSAKRRDRAALAADRAIKLAPELPDGYVARGRIRRGFQFDWSGAHADFQRAYELAPGDARAAAYSGADWLALGGTDRAIPLNTKAIDLDPLWPQGWNLLGLARFHAGKTESAREAFSRAMELAPGFDEPRLNLCQALLAERKPQQALAVGEGSESPWVRNTCMAMAHHDLGHPRESLAALDALVTTLGEAEQYSIATAHSWRGETSLAFEWLEKALTSPAPGMDWVKTDPALRSLHSDPRWKPFLRKLKLPVD